MKAIEIYTTKLKIRWLRQDLKDRNTYSPKHKIRQWIKELQDKLPKS